ncbi:MAG: hypothetical protein HXX13_02950 [Bacteroidetes bacterium]|nr:hypothetical protein [Bacteroidota bacterium]
MRKTNLFCFLLLLVSFSTFSQIRFEKGYLIDNENKRTECLIRNLDWKNNPSEFIYKLDGSGKTETGTLLNVKEFGVYNSPAYVRSTVEIDRTSSSLENLTGDKNPFWSRETIFLKLLVQGKYKLYYYEDKSINRFFFSVSDTSIRQLIYKEYLLDGDLAYNAKFRQQLWLEARIPNASMASFEKLDYRKQDLEKYFLRLNESTSDSLTQPMNRTKRESFNLKITPALNLSSISIYNPLYNKWMYHFQNYPTLNIGFETEFILPFNTNKWGLLVNPIFQSFKAEKDFGSTHVRIDLRSVEFPFGIRYYSYLKNNLKLFIDGFYNSALGYNFNSGIYMNTFKFEVGTLGSFAVGAGIEKDRLSFEFRYYTIRDLMQNYNYWQCNNTRLSFQLGYKLIRTRKDN